MRIVIPPFFGEFGVLVMDHMRFVHDICADEKIVCCEKGTECLFPSASSYYTDWQNPVEDANRCNRGPLDRKASYRRPMETIYRRIIAKYPDAPFAQMEYLERESQHRLVKIPLRVEPRLKPVDVVLTTRLRQFVQERNWPHWHAITDEFRSRGMIVGLAGAPATSVTVNADACAWEHPGGFTAGTIDLLSNCRLQVGTDTGVSHLAAMMDVPQLIFGRWDHNSPNQTHLMRIANREWCEILPQCWDVPALLVEAVQRRLGR